MIKMINKYHTHRVIDACGFLVSQAPFRDESLTALKTMAARRQQGGEWGVVHFLIYCYPSCCVWLLEGEENDARDFVHVSSSKVRGCVCFLHTSLESNACRSMNKRDLHTRGSTETRKKNETRIGFFVHVWLIGLRGRACILQTSLRFLPAKRSWTIKPLDR